MKKNFTVKDCTKENFEKSLDILKDAQKALKDKEAEVERQHCSPFWVEWKKTMKVVLRCSRKNYPQ